MTPNILAAMRHSFEHRDPLEYTWVDLGDFGSLEDAGGEIHDAFSPLMSIAFLPAVPRFILATGFCGTAQGCAIQPCLIDIKDEEAMLICCRIARAANLSSMCNRTPFCDSTPCFVKLLHTDPVLLGSPLVADWSHPCLC